MKILQEDVQFVRAVENKVGMVNLVTGDIIIDRVAGESCWPVGQGGAHMHTLQ
jgi:hypothetical protein